MRTKAALTSFYMPVRWLWPYLVAALVIVEIARIPLGAGYLLNTLLLLVTLCLFGYGFSRVRNTMTAGVAPGTHALGGLIFGALWSLVAALANTASSVIAYLRDYYYSSADPYFVQVTGERELIDTNGLPYIVDDGQITLTQFLLTFAVHLACLAGVAAIGAILGTIAARWNALAAIAMVVAGIVAAYLCADWMYNQGIGFAAPLPGVFVFMVPLAALGMMATSALILSWRPTTSSAH